MSFGIFGTADVDMVEMGLWMSLSDWVGQLRTMELVFAFLAVTNALDVGLAPTLLSHGFVLFCNMMSQCLPLFGKSLMILLPWLLSQCCVLNQASSKHGGMQNLWRAHYWIPSSWSQLSNSHHSNGFLSLPISNQRDFDKQKEEFHNFQKGWIGMQNSKMGSSMRVLGTF